MRRLLYAFVLSGFLVVITFPSCGIFVPSDDYVRQKNTTTRSGNDGSTSIRRGIVADALELTGVRYKYGGVNPRSGMDCSGLLNYVFQNAGITLRRSSREQVKDGFQIKKRDVKPGDLVFFSRGGQVFHVALITEYDGQNMQVIHATSSKGVIEQEILHNSYWTPKIHSYRDVISRR